MSDTDSSDASGNDDKRTPAKKMKREFSSASDSDDEPKKSSSKDAKRQKSDKKDSKASSSSSKKSKGKREASAEDEDGELKIDLGGNRFLAVREFKGKPLIDIREFYMDRDSGEMRPGKKGIALNPDQWKKLISSVSKIDKAVENL
ncbi:hypothetical protein RvY_16693 [Ramazzottius varieornatus]|uniref:Transcriptional coactivator p15 (PC4) C-terminal domain-containing protein n=1 Tax=Ramazzottius varieornatus TaxID=947166 RepID=A0A1D1W6S0_RAMVA|nr:hypothetical protein RvY_16693 [Ramazzottius varieornatus]